MCGIIGYIGKRKASEVILQGLGRIEYRGYDSAGIAAINKGKISIIKGEGKIKEIHKKKNFLSLEGNIGIGHTRWATHGPPCERNAHPHSDEKGEVVLVHNGIIENFAKLKEKIISAKINLKSDTDTELVAHLISLELREEKDVMKAVYNAVKQIEGAYALGIMVAGENKIYAARKHAPLIIGKGEGEMFFASDIPALLDYTKNFVLLNDGDFAEIDEKGCKIWDFEMKEGKREEIHVDWTSKMAEKGGHAHFMIKEILEQPEALSASIGANVDKAIKLLKNAKNIAIIGCGTSYYAGKVFEYLLHKHGINAASYIASEYFSWKTGKEDVIVAITQSGETADTLSAIRDGKEDGAKIIAITNVVGSSVTREADESVFIGVGPEIGVLATKSFLGQLAVLYKIAYTLSGNREMLEKLHEIPGKIKGILKETDEEVRKLAEELVKYKDFFFIARGIGYPCALEGALKLKEVTYLHAEAYPGGELKHGPLSLLQDDVVIFAIAPSGKMLRKMQGNIQECKARGAKIIVMSDDEKTLNNGNMKLKMPKFEEEFIPIYYIVPLQLLSYYMAVKMGRDPDMPRNLAKSVTVE
ncbi:MAG: glutamine--fructose-6-phosphate transaminase (isomerizing) [Candidatus Micrarchaeota archaeon]